MTCDEGLPSGWINLPLRELGEYVRGVTYQKLEAKDSATDSSVPVLRANNLGETDFILDALVHLDRTLVDAAQIIKKHDVVFAMSSGSLRHVGKSVMATRDMDAAFGAFCGLVRLHNGVTPAFVALQLKTPAFRKHVEAAAAGTNINNLKSSVLLSYPLVVAPLHEQRRIVAKIEELFSELDAAAESLTQARAQLKTYRQALLKAAFEGKLTADWRAANAERLKPAALLLATFRAERKALFGRRLQAWQEFDRAARRNAPHATRRPSEPRPLSVRALSTECDGIWPSLELGDVMAVSSGDALTSAEMRGGGCAVYGGNGIAGFHNDWMLDEPTVILGRVGAKCGVVHITRPHSWVTDNALIVTPLIESFDRRFFRYVLEFMNLNRLGSSTGQPVISGSKIYAQQISVPSFSEQVEIADRLEAIDSEIQNNGDELERALAMIGALRQSILKRAFSGRLVPQDPSDEAADKLLARIGGEIGAPSASRRKLPA